MKLIDQLDGYVLYVYNNGKVTEKVSGYCETKPNKVLTTKDTYYDIASLTKTYTAVIVYMAQEEGLLNIDDYVTKYDKNFVNLGDITIKKLLCHNQEIWTDGYLGDANNLDEFNKILYTSYVKGKVPKYVDVDYIILGKLLENIYGITLDKIFEEKIIKKLGLKHTTFKPTGSIASMNYEPGEDYNLSLGELHDKKARRGQKIGVTTGHASLFTNGEDLLLFLEAFVNNQLVSEETINIMLDHYDINKINKDTGYKCRTYNFMGVRYFNYIDELNDVPHDYEGLVSFSGYTGPRFLIDFKRKIIIVLMCNVVHNTLLNREERTNLTKHIVYEIYDECIK
jgi:CubicO group peptidase (beta-lactamase class C family)